jgi:hypothetical protein
VAAPCGAPDFLAALPRDGARSVPTNAALSAHYAASATYMGEPIHVEHAPANAADDAPRDPGSDIAGEFDANEGLLVVTLDGPLVASDRYVVTWPRLHGSTSSGLGKGGKVSFVAGDTTDTETPGFDGITSVAWDVIRVRDDCTDSLEDRFTFDLGLGAASDDGGRDSLELVIFQSTSSRGKGKEVLHAPIPARGVPMRVERALGDAEGSVCFSAIVRDLTGKFAGGDAPGVCTKTVPPPFFYGCGAARGAGSSDTRATVTIALVAVVLARRRRASA